MRPNGSAKRYYTPVKKNKVDAVRQPQGSQGTNVPQEHKWNRQGIKSNQITIGQIPRRFNLQYPYLHKTETQPFITLNVPTCLSRINLVLPTGYPIASLGNFQFSAYEELQRNII
jgi:hypothetical protein